MAFEPIAIVGRGCVLPGCLTPDALWQAVVEKRSLLSSPAPGLWGISDLDQAEGTPKGGFVTGFADVFDPIRPEYEALDVGRLDPVAQWLLHAGGEAWREAGVPDAASDRIAIIIGNLSYPSRGFSDFAANVWLERTGTQDPRNRFNSGYPAQALAQSIGASGRPSRWTQLAPHRSMPSSWPVIVCRIAALMWRSPGRFRLRIA